MTLCKKIKNNEYTEYSVYYAKISCLLCIEERYLVCITINDVNPVGSQEYLNNIMWTSFQTRNITNFEYKLNSQEYTAKSNDLTNSYFTLKEKTKDKYIYLSNKYQIKAEMLITEKDSDYTTKGTLKMILESFNSVISFVI